MAGERDTTPRPAASGNPAVRQVAETGDRIPTPREEAHQDKPEVHAYRVNLPRKENLDSDKAPITPKIYAPNQKKP